MSKKHVKIWLTFLLVFGLVIGSMQIPAFAALATNQGTVTVIGTDPAAPPSVPEKTVSFGPNDTAFNALVNAVGASNVGFNDDPTYGKYITSINGVASTNSMYWAFYLNGISSPVGVDSYHVQNGDKLTFKYVDYPTTLKSAASLKVVGKDQKVLYTSAYDISFLDNATAFQLLQVTLGNDKVGYSESKYGKFITSIDGVTPTGSDYWAFYVNGKKAAVGADSYHLQPGDQISFQYETWQSADNGSNSSTGSNNSSATAPISSSELQNAIDRAAEYTLKNQVGEWDVIALKQAGKTIPASYLENVTKQIADKQGKFSRITDVERYILGILAAGGDPTKVNGYNLVESVYYGNVSKQGLNGVAYALIALDSAQFPVPETAQWTREKLVSLLLQKQNSDGGWAWDGSTISDVDSTAMLLSALAPYKDRADVKAKVDAAVRYLSQQYLGGKINNSSSAAQTVIALSSLGIDANGSLFAKDGTSILKYLLSFQNADGGFDWQGGDKSDSFSTSQPFEALVAYQLMVNGKGLLYHLPLAANGQAMAIALSTNNTQTQGKQEGYSLPDTANNSANLILIGVGLMLIGAIYYIGRLRKKW
ncbi:DUF4430 domain-containing protein [Bacillota bacterium Lsc_1132]